jgi:hypothetical protein
MRYACLALALAACATTPKETPMTAPWSRIKIADGAANGFFFDRQPSGRVQFEYDPVTRAESSSGMYDGGPPRKEDLAADDARLAELWALLQRLEADKSIHVPDRNKGTGAISWEAPDGMHTFIIDMHSPGLAELLTLLKRFGK